MTVPNEEQASPWRRLFEEVRQAAGNERDEDGVRGSINWLRKQMERKGANPNVVRNIIYRDKGRLADKRVLFEVLGALWEGSGRGTLSYPELEVLLSHAGEAESEVVRLLGREKRRAYRNFVSAVRAGEHPKLVMSGRPGSGKTLLIDFIQEALEIPPRAPGRLVRLELGSGRLETGLSRLAVSVGVPAEQVESRIAKIGASGAFSVQADAQAEVARAILDAVRASDEPLILLAHVSRSSGSEEFLGNAPLRLNTPEVPRVSTAEWLWLTLFSPLSRLPRVALLVSMSELPARVAPALGDFGEPLRLNPPTINEARRFVKARLPQLDARQQELVVRRAGRSFEELRTLTLLSEVRQPPARNGMSPEEARQQNIAQLGALVSNSGDDRLRDFLAALAVLSLPEFPTFDMAALNAVREQDGEGTQLELAFLDPVPPDPRRYRPFSREFVRQLRRTFEESETDSFRSYSSRAAAYYRAAAESDPGSEEAARYLQHLFQARDWEDLTSWIQHSGEHQSLMPQMWSAAREELAEGEVFERVAYRVARHYVRLGAYEHPQARSAFAALEASADAELRSWALVQQAEGAVLRGQLERAEEYLERCPEEGAKPFRAEVALVRASISRWRSELDSAARLVEEEARKHLPTASGSRRSGVAVVAKAAVWAGLIAKDRGDLGAALTEFESVSPEDDLIEARVAFQRGDVLLSLGRLDAALAALDRSIELARESHALTKELSRYLARRGTLRRRRGEAAAAQADFDEARRIIALAQEYEGRAEREFWVARVDDEAALALLGAGQYEQAIAVFAHNIEVFRRYGEELGVDPGYRIVRSTLRLARSYLCRALGATHILTPLRRGAAPESNPDLRHASLLVGRAGASLDAASHRRYAWALRRDAYLLSSLLSADPAAAAAQAQCAVAESKCPQQFAESRGHLASAYLRGGEPQLAMAEIATALAEQASVRSADERGDLGLRAWLVSLALEAALLGEGIEQGARQIAAALREAELAPFHAPLLRVYGETIEEHGLPVEVGTRALAAQLDSPLELPDCPVRLPDALCSWWGSREVESLGEAAVSQ